MSGIAGIISTDAAPADTKLLERMAGALAFRGPDACHIRVLPGAGFCFTLLRTGPAPQASVQPQTIDDRLWLLADVRLDGRKELKHRLEAKNCVFQEEPTDERLILAAWHAWGEECLDFLRGDFCFAVWDSVSRTLSCVRDPMGARPFYYAQAGRSFIFSNTLAVVRLSLDVSDTLDPRAVGDFLLEAWCPDPDRTIFRDIRRLPAGHVLSFAGGELRIRKYAQLPIEEPVRWKKPQECVEAFRELLEHAVRDRLPMDSTAILLSGGLDSSAVAAHASDIARRENTGCALRAFTVDYRPLFDDPEGRAASRTAKHLRIPIELHPGGSSVPYARSEDPELRTPEPCHEPFLALQADQLRQIAAHTRVALSGDGGDSILTGQAWPYLLYLAKRARFGEIFASFGGYVFRHGRVPPLRGGFRAGFQRWLGRRDDGAADYPAWLNPAFEKKYNLRDRWRELREPPKLLHPVHPLAYAGLTSPYWPSLLEGEDAGWTRVPVETRAPLLDWRILTFLFRVPPVPWCVEKHLLRCATEGLLPDEVRLRPKTPLLEDPLALHAMAGNLPVTPPAAVGIEEYVNWPRVQAALAADGPLDIWRDLQPISLNYWLKSVEKPRGFE